MELSGALLNLASQGRFVAAARLQLQLLAREAPNRPVRRLRRRQGSVLEAVVAVLKARSEPMRVREIHASVERLFGAAVPFSSVNEALSTHAQGEDGLFRRV